jgi:hypothetical protein
MLFWMLWAPSAVAVALLTLMFIMNAMELTLGEFVFFGSGTAIMWWALLVPFW